MSNSSAHAQFEAATRGRWASARAFASQVARQVRRHLFSPRVVWVYWFINVVSLAAIIGWIFNDARFAEAALRYERELRSVLGNDSPLRQEPQLAVRVLALYLLSGLAIASVAGILLALFFGGAAHRRVRTWLGVTALMAAWLALFVSWPELLWRGQVHRLSSQAPNLQTMVTLLANDWPTGDGECAGLGPFLAYPLEQPEVLLLLTQAKLEGSPLTFAAVERSDVGALRFQLTGNETGSWLEWHPANDEPRGFVGGLLQQFSLDRFTKLGENWYLVRYQ